MSPAQGNSNSSTPQAPSAPLVPSSPTTNPPPGQSPQGAGQQPTSNNQIPDSPPWLKPLYIIIAICFLIIAGVLIWFIAFNNGFIFGKSETPTPKETVKPSAVTISGNILFQGYASSSAYLTIAAKSEDDSEYNSVVTSIEPTTGAIPWTWKNAKAGKNYKIQAQLKVAGKTIQTSTSNELSAPASNVNLILVSEQDPPAPITTQVAGNVNINGYIPQGANVVITADTTSGAGGVTTLPSISAIDDTPFTWSNAILGTSYDLTAQLVDSSGNPLGQPSSINITAPSSGLQFNINSTAQPPAPQPTGLSGNVIINGNIPTNAYITIGTRVTGTTSFNQVVNNTPATSNVSWSWAQAQTGTNYDIQAYLWVNGQPNTQSQIITVAAPSDGNTLTINAQQPTSAPAANTMSVSCSGQQGGSYQATINFNTQSNLSNAQSYNVIVTLASQGTQVVNTTVTPPNPTGPSSFTTGFIFTPGATYYAQYAYANSTNTSSFSPLSPAIQFSCR